MKPLVSQISALVRKDLLLDWRGRGRVLAVLAFGVTALFLFSLAVGPDSGALVEHAGGFLWLTVLLSSVLSLSESFRVELEDEALESLRLMPTDPRALFFAKAIANTFLLLLLGAILLPFSFVLFGAAIKGSICHLAIFFALGSAGLAAPGTLYTAMTAQARGRDVLLPLLLFPLVVPVLIAAVRGTSLSLVGDPMQEMDSWRALLIAFDLVYWSLCPLLFERVIEA